MNKKTTIILFIIFIIIVGLFLFKNKSSLVTEVPQSYTALIPTAPNTGDIPINHVAIGGVTLNVDVASTPETQEQGLSGRTNLAQDAGMLFVFAQTGNYPFWMKDMNFPIDMIWIDQNLKVIYIQKDAEPSSYPATFGPSVSNINTKYVLEVVSGFANKNNVQIGDSVSFSQ